MWADFAAKRVLIGASALPGGCARQEVQNQTHRMYNCVLQRDVSEDSPEGPGPRGRRGNLKPLERWRLLRRSTPCNDIHRFNLDRPLPLADMPGRKPAVILPPRGSFPSARRGPWCSQDDRRRKPRDAAASSCPDRARRRPRRGPFAGHLEPR